METQFDLSLNARSAGRAGRMNTAGIIETAHAVKGTPAAPAFAAAVAELVPALTDAAALALARFNRRNDRAASAAYNTSMRRLSAAEHAARIVAR
jgi:hypothetical protein